MSNFDLTNVSVNMPVPAEGLDSDPQQLEALRARLRRESQERFAEEANAPFMPRED